MLKKSLIAAASLLALSIATGASAADLPRKTVAPVFVAPPAFTWTGFYVGVNAGYAFGEFARTGVPNPAFFLGGSVSTDRKFKADGFAGGAQAGFNYQIGSFVVGLEGDFNFADAKSSTSEIIAAGAASNFYTQTSKVEWFATIRPRLGIAFDRLLVYGTGGIAFGSVKVSDTVDFTPGGAPAVGAPGTSSSIRTGYAVGAGLEYAVLSNLTVKAEYLFVDLGKTSYVNGDVPGFPGSFVSFENKTRLNIVRAGVNYKF